jgi:dTDP-4-amino-4,6-dideoxygalactose transaminase
MKLAIDGGPKAVTNALAGWPSFSEMAIKSVEAVLRSGKVNCWTGSRGREFEQRFADVNLEDHCISIASAERLVNARTKAIIPVHLYGNVCDMDPILAFARRHGLRVIEDNAEAFGGEYKGRKTGTLGHMAAMSRRFPRTSVCTARKCSQPAAGLQGPVGGSHSTN